MGRSSKEDLMFMDMNVLVRCCFTGIDEMNTIISPIIAYSAVCACDVRCNFPAGGNVRACMAENGRVICEKGN